MSLDITFQKEFTIEDVENKTSIKAEYNKGQYWLVKNGSHVLINSYTSTEEDIKNYDNGKKKIVDGLTSYGLNSISEILDELVLTFQTQFMTDEEENMIYHNQSIDVDEVFSNATKKYGYNIDNDGNISRNDNNK